jgi:nitrilase
MSSPDVRTSFRVAVIQHPPVFLNLERSLAKAIDLIEDAASHGAKVIAFPETWLPGYPVWLDFSPSAALWDHAPAKALYRVLVQNSVSIPGGHVDKLLRAAEEAGTYVIMGAHEIRGGTLYNTMVYVDKGGQASGLHRKLVPAYTERMIWGRGDGSTLSVVDTEHGKLGGLICWEHWMPLARAVKELHQLASRHYAFEGQCFVLAAGCVLSRGEIIDGFRSLKLSSNEAMEILEAIPGTDEDLVLSGGSAVIGPDGRYLAGPVVGERCIIYADIELNRITEGHLVLDTSGHYSRPDVFQLVVNDQPQSAVSFRSRG